ncbi:MAG TPA: 16S rRNA (adenine(1518)-N(6)/adenine(1519)-N(6))-dimethyltransferase RsmA [Candidatus Omnitrophota bacterium]|nr:16S rRNA (adenine(1518)-N(6)/adenine(1519)-N(6))-dimethyltransferase RsmA [Candidatus Omnitrophota bacterium]HRZ15684.1 16S rRNA (adenine(1518)-N(6)/adenine(1519)-N(6))-dimethyltransferase RsmA [Candidatus Omnitrophota bacterium]
MRARPKKSLGQNFLVDPHTQRKIFNACGFKDSDSVVEIGPGKGAMTKLLAPAVRHVYAIDLDAGLVEMLQREYGQAGNVTIIHHDILTFDLSPVIAAAKKKIVVFGNIPYYITTPIIEYLFEYRRHIDTVFLTIQKEVADRICAEPGSKIYGSLSCFVQYYAHASKLVRIPRGCFYPIPKVDSCCIRLQMLPEPSVRVKDEVAFFDLIHAAFQQRRKTLRNSLKEIIPEDKLDAFFRSRGIFPLIRPEKLSLENFAALANL